LTKIDEHKGQHMSLDTAKLINHCTLVLHAYIYALSVPGFFHCGFSFHNRKKVQTTKRTQLVNSFFLP